MSRRDTATKLIIFQVPRVLSSLKAEAFFPDLGEGREHLAGWMTVARTEGTVQ